MPLCSLEKLGKAFKFFEKFTISDKIQILQNQNQKQIFLNLQILIEFKTYKTVKIFNFIKSSNFDFYKIDKI